MSKNSNLRILLVQAQATESNLGMALSIQRLIKRRRLNTKTNVQSFCIPGPLGVEDGSSHRSVYLVTLSHPHTTHSDGIALVAPATVSREGVRNAIQFDPLA